MTSAPQVTATVTIAPRDAAVLSFDATALRTWVQRAFEAPCELRAPPSRAGDRVRAEVVLSTSDVRAADRALLAARTGDQPLWRAWVEQACIDGRCDVLTDVVVMAG